MAESLSTKGMYEFLQDMVSPASRDTVKVEASTTTLPNVLDVKVFCLGNNNT